MGIEKEYLEHNKVKMSYKGAARISHIGRWNTWKKKYDERDGEVCPWWIDDSRVKAVGRRLIYTGCLSSVISI